MRGGLQAAQTEDWLAAYQKEMRHAHMMRPTGPVESVFFGGGTPSLMSPQLVAGLLDEMAALWGLAPHVEITLEANPVSAPEAHLKELRAAGVTRLSLGVQAFDDAALKFLGRTHTAEHARLAFRAAQEIFPFSSFDLIYARPHQSLNDWQAELQAALALAPRHMSLYQLTIEPDTPFARKRDAGHLSVPDEDAAAALYELTQDLTEKAGLPAYEISNHAQAGHECRHNVASWQGGDYIGLGPGAHGRLTTHEARFATMALRDPQGWRAQIREKGHGWEKTERLDDAERAVEAVLLGLRLRKGRSLTALAAQGVALSPQGLADARAAGLLSDDETRLQASDKGRLLLDTLLGLLL